MTAGPNRWIQALFLAALLVVAACRGREESSSGPASPTPAPPLAKGATFVGREACAPCHAEEDRRWKGSHHDLAMQEATAETVLGNFDDATFTHYGVTSTFFKRDGKFFVKTDGPDGRLHEYPIAYTFGVYPLQQYLIAFPGGRYQALNVCWDTRPAKEGGQRWFHLYPKEEVSYTRSAPLDRSLPELELHVRGVPLDQREEGLFRRRRTRTRRPGRSSTCPARPATGPAPRTWPGARPSRRGRRARTRPTRASRHARGSRALRGLGDGHEDRHRQAQRPPHLASGDRDLRALPRAALGRLRGLRLRPAAPADAPAGAARRGALLPGRADPGRGLRVRLVPAEQDVRGRRHLHRLPRRRTT